MSSFDVTRKQLVLGDRDTYTGWRSRTYVDSTVQCVIRPKGQAFTIGGYGYVARYDHTGYSDDEWDEGDLLVDNAGVTYEVASLQPEWWGDSFGFYVMNLRQITPFDPERVAASSGWHVDGDSVTTDPRLRIMSWMNGELNPAVGGAYAVMFAGADYPLSRELSVGNLDCLYVVDAVDSQPEYTYDHYPYKFNEKVVVHCYAVNKTAKTAPVILEQMEQELRRITTDQTFDAYNIKAITSAKQERLDIGSTTLWHTAVELSYTRSNHEYTPSYPRVTYSSGSIYYFPNCIKVSLPNVNNDVSLLPPGRVPTIWQALGSEGLEVQLTCDLDYETESYTWKRPQTSESKTDKVNYQVFLDIMHGAQVSETYQTLYLSANFSFKVRLVRMEPALGAEGNLVTLTFKEYNATNQTATTYTSRFGLT